MDKGIIILNLHCSASVEKVLGYKGNLLVAGKN
jgi:hypothetical protein